MKRRRSSVPAGEPMLAQVEAWAAVNSGSRNLVGLGEVAGLLADAFAVLPGELDAARAGPVDAIDAADGSLADPARPQPPPRASGREAPVQLLFTGHMDTVFAADHAFQDVFWRDEGVLGGPGVADMKGGIAVHARGAEGGGGIAVRRRASAMKSSSTRRGGRLARLGRADRRGGARQEGGADLRAVGLARRHAGRCAARKRQFLAASYTAAAPMPAATPRTGATPCSPRPSWRFASPKRKATGLCVNPAQDRRRRARTMSSPILQSCASTCVPRRSPIRRARRRRSTRRWRRSRPSATSA